MINTVVRQVAFYTFERKLHTERRKGELTVERLNALWLEVQRESLGEAIELKPGYETFWAYISHFVHSPFYVYAYAFGDCLVNSLYAAYEGAHQGFAERYLVLLRAGGTLRHKELQRLLHVIASAVAPEAAALRRCDRRQIQPFLRRGTELAIQLVAGVDHAAHG